MVFIMRYQVDGGCRGNGTPYAVGVAACIPLLRNGLPARGQGRILPPWPTPTNQRAELTAIILVLSCARKRYEELDVHAELHLVIETDSKYAIGCMNV
jgi:ribonuclease HI